MWSLPASDVERLIAEDVPSGDLTTEALGIGTEPGRITFKARGAMTVAGIEIAADMLRHCGASVDVWLSSSNKAEPGQILLEGFGSASALHRGWKASQTLVEILSGLATGARAVVEAVEQIDPRTRVACTRKTWPGGRRLSHIAVKAGGAILHRAGLSETVLMFPEHRAFAPDEPWNKLLARLRRSAPEKKIVIEVGTMEEAKLAIAAGFDVIQLEKFKPEQVAEIATVARSAWNTPLVAAAGGINPKNAGDYAEAGAGLIVTSWPYTAPPTDVKVLIELQP
jgi:molybdenum transport protein